jgi:hypothetical protein
MSGIAIDASERNGKGTQRDQTSQNLTASADGGNQSGPPVPALQAEMPKSKADAVRSTAMLKATPPCYTCKVHLKVAVFFDGTGNNLDADIGTNEHSNVARLYRSHPDNDAKKGIYRIYVPGLGTYFKDIGDPGNEDGLAFGKLGEPRLIWAMEQIDKHVAAHPQANIVGIDIALFGFSRGAALARAFALLVQKRCKEKGDKWLWDKGDFFAELYFMGLFDTVASVGLPASSSIRSAEIAKGWVTLDNGLKGRRHDQGNGLEPFTYGDTISLGIAFGKSAGADPTPGMIDGHMDWASDMRIPSMARKCVHFFSTHEQRNSFPLDSAREGSSQAFSVEEHWCPGVHSDVGGGYRPGEGGRSLEKDQLLSLMPLITMHSAALSAGVPLSAKNDPRSGNDFEVSEKLVTRYNEYIKVAESHCTKKHVEGRILGNAKMLFAWRFKRIRERGAGPRADAATIASQEKSFANDRTRLDQEIATAQREPARLAAQTKLKAAETEHSNARLNYLAFTSKDWVNQSQMSASLSRMKAAESNLAVSRNEFLEADDAHMKLQARKATLPGSGLTNSLSVYDEHLLLDVAALLRMQKTYPNARLRPHYANLLEAYEAEYERNNGLLDAHPEVLAFFDNYVHDSLAGFAKDQTLPSDPRVVYVGGDTESKYAMRKNSDASVAIA